MQPILSCPAEDENVGATCHPVSGRGKIAGYMGNPEDSEAEVLRWHHAFGILLTLLRYRFFR